MRAVNFYLFSASFFACELHSTQDCVRGWNNCLSHWLDFDLSMTSSNPICRPINAKKTSFPSIISVSSVTDCRKIQHRQFRMWCRKIGKRLKKLFWDGTSTYIKSGCIARIYFQYSCDRLRGDIASLFSAVSGICK